MALVGFGIGLHDQVKLPPHLLAALVPLLALILALDIFCLIDLARATSVRGMPKIVWAFVIVFISSPIGAASPPSSPRAAPARSRASLSRPTWNRRSSP